ncbi:PAS domain S-box protein [Aquabacter sp. CN5-332]|uniref:PAS domain S-box protein n=1 Tax=Aquabacter sp. CN5-332 TaxID=3156608 RepID=UPI0032B4B71B
MPEGNNAQIAAPARTSGLRKFTVERRQAESDVITSFILRPVDGSPVEPHEPGQHLTMLLDLPGKGRVKHNYTISCAPNGETLRISVKREPKGGVSQWLHDEARPGTEIEILCGSGSFVLDRQSGRPVVLLSAGVGITPMIAILEGAASKGLGAPLHFIHIARDGAHHAFRDHVRELAAELSDAQVRFFYSHPRPADVQGRDFDIAGRLTLDWVLAHTPVSDADYYVCGPIGFLRTFVPGLARAGVSDARLHYEFFGTVEDLFDEEPESAPPPQAPAQSPPPARGAKAGGGFMREAIGGVILDSAAEAVIATDREGMIVLWNPGAERIFGFSEDEALGASLDIIIPEPLRARHWEGYHDTARTGQSRYGAGDLLSVPGLRKDGKRVSLEFTIALLKARDGSVEGMVAVLRDITARFEELKALKKQLATQSSETR